MMSEKRVPADSIWPLDPRADFLNHGSFGSCPTPVLEAQRRLRDRMERSPIDFFVRDLEGLWDAARAELGQFVGSRMEDIIFVPNATAGVNTVLRSLEFEPRDEVLVTDHEYNACRNALDFVASRSGFNVVVAKVPFPLRAPDQVLAAVLESVTPRTKLVLLDHVTSQTGLIFPLLRIVRELTERGIDALVDGAHAPGMIPLNLEALGVAYYTGNCHKWICAPKGSAFLHVRRDKQNLIHPLSISHGANSMRRDRSRFLIEFGWTGTWDPSAALCVPEALRFMGSLLPGGWAEVMAQNHTLALQAREILCRALAITPPSPDEIIGALVSLPLPDAPPGDPPKSPLYSDPLHDKLREDYGIEVPLIPWPAAPKRLIRVSAQMYNTRAQYERLGAALRNEFQPR